jgi:hypothetical protein
MEDWTAFGRIDADGNVFVKTADGERPVGSWQAGTPEEGLAHFARRYDDLVTEVNLVEARLASGAADAQHSLATIKRLHTSLAEAHVVGDIDGLSARLEKLTAVAAEKADAARAAREVARTQALEAKTVLVTEAETIAATSTSWKASGDRFTAILEEWKAVKGVDRKADGELWKRFATARDTFTRRRGAHFATLDASRKQAQSRKDELVAEAESLSDSSDWTVTANRLKELMAEWKAAPRASKEVEQKLWERFRAAQDAFFTRRSEVFSARDAESKQTLAARQELLTQAEALDIEADPKAAQAAMRDIQAKWHDAGRAPRDAAANLDRRMRAVDDKIREAMDVAWRRPEPSASPLLLQMREQVAEAEARLERAKTAGDAKRIREAEQALTSKKQFLALAESAS